MEKKTPEEVLNLNEILKAYRLTGSETYKKLVVIPSMEEYAELARQEEREKVVDKLKILKSSFKVEYCRIDDLIDLVEILIPENKDKGGEE